MPIGGRVMVLSATFDNGVPVETADLSRVTEKLLHIMLYRVNLSMSGIWTHNSNGEKHSLYR